MNSRFGLWSEDWGPVPLKGVRVEGDVLGRGARIKVVQKFRNIETKPVEAIYRFPLPETAAICGLRAHVGDTTIEGAVEEREKAFEIYDKALIRGHGSYLLDKERPNIFTLSVGNLNPGSEAVIEIEFVTLLDAEDSKLRFVLPTAISPRFVPDEMPDDHGIPESERIHPVYAPDVPYGLSMSIKVHKAELLQSIESPSHPIRVNMAADPVTVELSAESVRMDRDFILYLGYKDLATMSSAYRWESRDGDFIQLDLALQSEDEQLIRKREIVFVLDCSGSMQGDSIAEAKKALEICLKGLEPGTEFNVYRFGWTFERLFKKTAIYDEETLGFALDYLRGTGADLGGTLMLGPLKDIYSRKVSKGSSGRDIILITDGEVANEDEVLALVGNHSDTTRVFALGIGAGPNEYLIRGLAKAAHGVSGFIFPGERIEPRVLGMFRDVMGRCAEDVSIEWGSDGAIQAPELPVIFLGRPTAVFAHYGKAKRKPGAVTLRGIVNGQEKSWEVRVDDVGSGSHRPAISTLWARERIRDLETSGGLLAIKGSKQVGRKSKLLRKMVIDISRQFGVLSRFTSYVAVEKRRAKDKTKGEVALRRVPALVTIGWHGLGDVGLPFSGVTFPTLSGPRMMAYIELRQDLTRPSTLGRHERRQYAQAARKSREGTRKRIRRQDIVLNMLELQQAEGGFELDKDVAGRLGLKIKDLKKLAEKIEVDVEVDTFRLLCTAVVIKTLAIHFVSARPVWEGTAAKSIKWLNRIVTEGSPRLEKKLLMEWADDYTRRKVRIKI